MAPIGHVAARMVAIHRTGRRTHPGWLNENSALVMLAGAAVPGCDVFQRRCNMSVLDRIAIFPGGAESRRGSRVILMTVFRFAHARPRSYLLVPLHPSESATTAFFVPIRSGAIRLMLGSLTPN